MQGIYQSFIAYLQGSYQELRRVIWPSLDTTVRLTLVVIAVSVGVALILGAFDAFFSYILGFLISL